MRGIDVSIRDRVTVILFYWINKINHFIAMTQLHGKHKLEYQQAERAFKFQCLWLPTEIKTKLTVTKFNECEQIILWIKCYYK